MRADLNKSFGFQSIEGLANWRATDFKFLRYLVLIKLLTRREVPIENRFSKACGHPVGQNSCVLCLREWYFHSFYLIAVTFRERDFPLCKYIIPYKASIVKYKIYKI